LHAKEILLQFLKFENLILLLQIINNNIEFQVTTERNIVDLKTAQYALRNQGKQPLVSGGILLPIERINQINFEESNGIPKQELIWGRLPEFCPEALQS
jgi:hypothetical protein